ncbi:MAG TPA: HIT domain-containing protein, partial [Solirubrobacteraceae bacterium]|nr:HIT domain-containing protein [Solirubrobacteraceae bacterium]
MTEQPLWAPWRIQYITGPKSDQCVFCVAASADETTEPYQRPLERGRRGFTLLNAFPYTSGHLMVAPFRHVATLDELDDEELTELMRLAQRGIAAQRAAMSPDGFNVGLNLGRVAGAGIADHLHLHVVPRWEGDNSFMPVLADIRVLPQALEATYQV